MSDDSAMPGRTLIVVVLYGVKAHEAASVVGVEEALLEDKRLRDGYELLLWDNGPDASVEPELRVPFRYERAIVNDGVAGAFNAASRICIERGYEWMLLLDQDTVVTREYLEGMLRYRLKLTDDKKVAAVAPLLFDDEFQLSPKRVLRFRDVVVKQEIPGIVEAEVFAANSGVMMRVSALNAIGGYSADFWLDHSDMYVFHQFHVQGLRTFVAADLRLQHSMTMQDYDNRMTPRRYENFLHAEQALVDLYKDSLENAVQALRLMMRSIKQRRYRNKAYAGMTWRFLLYRLMTSKSKRLQGWGERRRIRHIESTRAD